MQTLDIRSLCLDNIPVSVMVYDLDGNCVYANREACLARGYPEAEFSRLSIKNLCPDEYLDEALRSLESLREKCEVTYSCVHRRRDSSYIRVHVHARALEIGGRRLALSCATKTDMEMPCQYNDAPLLQQEMLDATPYCIMLVDSNKVIRYVNNATVELFGYKTRGELLGSICHEIVCPAEKDKCPVWDQGQKLDKAERKAITREGRMVPILKSAARISSNGEELLLEAFVDISRIKEAEEFISGILESVDEGFIVIDRDYRIISANRAFLNQCKTPSEMVLNDHCYRISHHSDKPCHEVGEDCAVRHTFATGEPHVTLHTHQAADGKQLFVETKSYPLRDSEGNISSAIEIINDITDRRKLEEQLRQSQKMEAVGTLAGGIAHDFNNILTTILGYSEFIRNESGEDSKTRKYIDTIISSVSRASRLTQSLLAFSRKQVIHLEPVNLNSVVERMQSMISRLIGEDIEVKARIAKEPLIVMADGLQIEQILMNLATNARDAMPRGGTFLLTTEILEMDMRYVATHGYGSVGNYALLTVSDNGVGMDNETLSLIFEPFYTTKPVGQGTGLGLAMAYGIIKQHNGYVNVYSEPNLGTTFKIILPLIKAETGEVARGEPAAAKRGSETILVAEDDNAVRRLIVKTLTDHGYKVIEAENGEVAIEKLNRSIEDIDMLLLDMIMPKKSGMDIYREGRSLRPGIKAMLISGYPAEIIDRKQTPEKGLNLLMKPVSPTDLLRRIREVLDS